MSNVMEILKEKNNLTVSGDGQIVVVPTSPYEFRTSPLIEGESALMVSEDAYIGLLLKLYQFDVTLKNVVPFDQGGFGAFMRTKFASPDKRE